jgi:hypothetical protein
MTGIEAIPKISLLIGQLIMRVKDTKTANLVQQIQAFQHIIAQDIYNLQAENTKLQAENVDLDKQLAQIKSRKIEPMKHRVLTKINI